MSFCAIYAIRKDGTLDLNFGKAHNAWGGAMHIWETLAQKYLRRRFNQALNPDQEEEFWELFHQPYVLSARDQIVLGFTYDGVWVKQENLPRLWTALEEFWAEHHTQEYSERGVKKTIEIVDTIPEIITSLKRAHSIEGLRGVCFNQTSVNQDTWSVRMTFEEYQALFPDATLEDFNTDRHRRREFIFGKDTHIRSGEVWELFENIDSTLVKASGGIDPC